MVKDASSTRTAGVRRRQIGAGDLGAVARFLSGGFRLRPRSYWMRGFERLGARSVPDGYPRFGYMLEADGRVVGVLLTIFSAIDVDGVPTIRCNLSSWYVEPAFRGHATLLLSYALKDRHVTYVNVSPAPNTWSTIQVQGFRPFGTGKFLAFPALGRAQKRASVKPLHDLSPAERGRLAPPDLSILTQHAECGCVAVAVLEGDDVVPFVFARGRILHRLVPTLALVYCRDLADMSRFARPLGRYLLGRGSPSVLLDAEAAEGGLIGLRIERDRSRFARGPHPPRPGDLAFTEGVFFAR